MSHKRGRKSKLSSHASRGDGKAKEVIIICMGLILAAIPFCYGKYFEFKLNDPFDSALNVYSAKSIIDGQKLGPEVKASARPATLLVNIIGVAIFGYSEFGPKLIQTLMQLAALAMMFYTLRKIYGSVPALVSLILASFYLSCPPFAKYGNVKEQFMIACMIISISAVVLSRTGSSWWWLVISGAFAINTYYFKPTGVSVIIATVVYFLAGFVCRRRGLFRTVSDFCGFIFGMAAGLIPIVILYASQGQSKVILSRFPGSAVVPATILAAGCVAIYYTAGFMQRRGSLSVIDGGISKIIGYITAVAVVAVLAVCFRGKIAEIFGQIAKLINPAGGYVAASRASTTFLSQYDNIMGYYGSFVVPIGLSLAAIFWSAKRSACRVFCGTPERTEHESMRKGEGFVFLFALWWILDMLFVWVSPRSYVQYYLPLNASAAFLAGYAIYRCQKKSVGLVWLLAIWLAVDIVLKWVIPSEILPYIAIRAADAMQNYSSRFLSAVTGLAVGIGIYWFGKVTNSGKVCVATIILICGGMFFWWNAPNFRWFDKRIKECKSGQSQWEKLADYINENSSTDDGLYVWGWMPGIYIQAQRSNPTKNPSYGNMHTDNPARVAGLIKNIVAGFKENPPKYIVDSQKIHFPYYEHPNFDLWPSWEDKKKTRPNFRVFPQDLPIGKLLFSLAEMKKFELDYNKFVENRTRSLLRHPRHKGGPVEEQRAQEMAATERQRHEAMMPLRKFVMENYKIVPISFGTSILYERK